MLFRKSIISIIVLLLIVVLGIGWFLTYQELQKTKAQVSSQRTNEKIVDFAKFFTEKVLGAEGEVSFDDRLKLENSVREIGDKEVLNQWQAFVDSKTQEQAQEEVKNLIEVLINKIIY